MDRSERVEAIAKSFSRELYHDVALSLFAKDQLVFSLLYAAKMNDVPATELAFFASTGSIGAPSAKHPDKPDFLSAPCWELVCRAGDELRGHFASFSHDVAADESHWFREYVESSSSTLPPLPSLYESTMSPFQRLIVVRCLRPDRIVSSIEQYNPRDPVRGVLATGHPRPS